MYNQSKWKSLEHFFLDEQQKISDKMKLLEDLLEYYRIFKLKQSMRPSEIALMDIGYNVILQGSVNYCYELINTKVVFLLLIIKLKKKIYCANQ